jgi:hypothetical protein
MATLILSPGETLKDIITVIDEQGKGYERILVDIDDIDLILQKQTRGQKIIQGPFHNIPLEEIDELLK